MNKSLIILVMLFAIIITSCQNNNKPQDVKETPEYRQLLAENDSLKKMLEPIINQQQKEKANSKGIVYNGKISIIKIETGFDPYHNSSNLWLPCVAIKFKNISSQDISKLILVSAIFIDNSKGEQIGSSEISLVSSSDMFISGTTKQINLSSSIGWYAVQNQDVSVKIYMEDYSNNSKKELVQTLKISNAEFDGMIR